MLASTKIDFKVKFSTHSKDVSCLIRDGRQEVELPHTNFHFKTGRSNQNVGHNSGSKKLLSDLQTRILPGISKEYLKNEQVRDCLNNLESVFSEV